VATLLGVSAGAFVTKREINPAQSMEQARSIREHPAKPSSLLPSRREASTDGRAGKRMDCPTTIHAGVEAIVYVCNGIPSLQDGSVRKMLESAFVAGTIATDHIRGCNKSIPSRSTAVGMHQNGRSEPRQGL